MVSRSPVKPGLRYSGFGRLVRQRRRELGMTQTQLAELVGIDQAHLSKIELGVLSYQPSHERAIAIAAALDLPAAAIERATDEALARVDRQLADAWAVSRNPVQDLTELAPHLSRADLLTLVRLARVMAAGHLVDRDG